MTLCLALSYGGRDEVVTAVRSLATRVKGEEGVAVQGSPQGGKGGAGGCYRTEKLPIGSIMPWFGLRTGSTSRAYECGWYPCGRR